MKTSFIPIYAALALTLAAGCKKDEVATSSTRTTSANATQQAGTAATSISREETDFIAKAARGGEYEVVLGREIARKATSPDVKRFAETMVADHGKANAELKELAAAKHVEVHEGIDANQKEKVDDLSKLSGAKLEKEYADEMVDDHEDDVEAFREASKNVKDADLRAWVTKTLPTLEHHLGMAKEMKARRDR